jgi:hypothetical protein
VLTGADFLSYLVVGIRLADGKSELEALAVRVLAYLERVVEDLLAEVRGRAEDLLDFLAFVLGATEIHRHWLIRTAQFNF